MSLRDHGLRYGLTADALRGWIETAREEALPGRPIPEQNAALGIEERARKQLFPMVALIDRLAKERGHTPLSGGATAEPADAENHNDRRKFVESIRDGGEGFVRNISGATDAYIGAILMTISTQERMIEMQAQQIADLRSRLGGTGS